MNFMNMSLIQKKIETFFVVHNNLNSLKKYFLTILANALVQVMLCYENRNYLLCTLQKDSIWQVPLDLNFQEGTKIAFTCNGEGHVHLTGYLIPEDEDIDDFDEEDMEEEIPELVEINKKRKTDNSPKNKNGKKPKMEVDEEDDDESDDLDDDDEENGLLDSEDDSDDDEEEEEDDEEDEESDDEDEEEEVKAPVQLTKKQKQKQKQEQQSQQQNQSQQSQGKKEKNKLVNGKDSKPEKEQGKQKKNKDDSKTEQQQQQQQQKKRKIEGGVQVEDLKQGSGAPAKSGKFVSVYYVGKLKNGKKFDQTNQGEGFKFRLGKGEVIKGWDVGIAGMKVGGKRRITIPPNMG